MMVNPGIFLAAMGIMLLEMSEASAVSMALSADARSARPFVAAILGIFVVLGPATVLGKEIAVFPIFYIRLASAVLLLYFGQRLMKSARRSMKFQYLKHFPKSQKEEPREKGVNTTAFLVGATEAFEAAIVLVALYPQGFISTIYGAIFGGIIVILGSFILRTKIRQIKQAIMKVVVASLLLTFSLFWFIESVIVINDIYLIPIFLLFFVLVYEYSIYGLGNLVSEKSEPEQD
ncbi:MAG: hypothetical protein M1496_01860 [Candidatus Thermoplasmatota archaeon]|jgi:uncharacterized membrane protein|nr:hypothetical protein [Candidatus Thermoplasmatota archaeon]